RHRWKDCPSRPRPAPSRPFSESRDPRPMCTRSFRGARALSPPHRRCCPGLGLVRGHLVVLHTGALLGLVGAVWVHGARGGEPAQAPRGAVVPGMLPPVPGAVMQPVSEVVSEVVLPPPHPLGPLPGPLPPGALGPGCPAPVQVPYGARAG